MKDKFELALDAALAPTRERPAMPPPGELLSKGIATQAVLDHMAQRQPPVPAPEPTPDDPQGWRTAVKNTDAEHQKQIVERQRSYDAKFEKARADFDTARSVRPHERRKSRSRGVER